MSWFELNSSNDIDSPSLLFFKERIKYNIQLMIKMVGGNTERLVPHIKTHKTAEIVRMMQDAGITKFKCSTIAEAELLAENKAPWVLIAHQPVGTRFAKLIELSKTFPETQFGTIIDNAKTLSTLNKLCQANSVKLNVMVDVNNGMNRTGLEAGYKVYQLCQQIDQSIYVNFTGLHVYDGHIRDQFFRDRKKKCDEAFSQVQELSTQLMAYGINDFMIIAGGSPSFSVHSLRKGVYCSPGTVALWDWGYGDKFKEQAFQHAAVLFTRVISKPAPNLITVDLGHKGVAAENPLENRLRFLNLSDYTLISQSEEHSVIQVGDWDSIEVGQALYAIPYHVCPTVALYDSASVVSEGEISENWKIRARSRKLTI